MTRTQKGLTALLLLALLSLALATPALAFEGRSGERIVIGAGEVIEDDLYVGANEFVLDGTVTGDLIVGGTVITINGTVEGDLWAAGQVVIVNGTVTDDARIAGAGLQLGPNAQVGDDLLAAGASLELQAGSAVAGDVLVASGQTLLAGEIAGDVLAGTGALELRGEVGGDVKAYVDQTEETAAGPSPTIYMQQNIPLALPSVAPGLTIVEGAEIGGDLEYSSTYDLSFPSGIVGGQVTRVEPEFEEQAYTPPTPAERTLKWGLDLLRSMVTLVLLGLLFAWLAPKALAAAATKIETQTWPSLGWGFLTWAIFVFILLLIVVVMIAGGILFGALTLGGLSGTVIWLGLLALFALTVTFVLASAFVSKIVVGNALGKWAFGRINPALAEHRYWPMVLGVVLIVLVIGMFQFPLLPVGFFGWLLNTAVVLFGLGALWLWGRDRLRKPPVG